MTGKKKSIGIEKTLVSLHVIKQRLYVTWISFHGRNALKFSFTMLLFQITAGALPLALDPSACKTSALKPVFQIVVWALSCSSSLSSKNQCFHQREVACHLLSRWWRWLCAKAWWHGLWQLERKCMSHPEIMWKCDEKAFAGGHGVFRENMCYCWQVYRKLGSQTVVCVLVSVRCGHWGQRVWGARSPADAPARLESHVHCDLLQTSGWGCRSTACSFLRVSLQHPQPTHRCYPDLTKPWMSGQGAALLRMLGLLLAWMLQ